MLSHISIFLSYNSINPINKIAIPSISAVYCWCRFREVVPTVTNPGSTEVWTQDILSASHMCWSLNQQSSGQRSGGQLLLVALLRGISYPSLLEMLLQKKWTFDLLLLHRYIPVSSGCSSAGKAIPSWSSVSVNRQLPKISWSHSQAFYTSSFWSLTHFYFAITFLVSLGYAMPWGSAKSSAPLLTRSSGLEVGVSDWEQDYIWLVFWVQTQVGS